MKKRLIFSFCLLAVGLLLVTGCSVQFQSKRGVAKTGETMESNDSMMEDVAATTHTVVKGETLWDISGDVYGDPTKWKLIYNANRDILDSPDALKPGQELIIPQE